MLFRIMSVVLVLMAVWRPVRAAESSWEGKAVLLTFIYDHCPDVCPLIVGNLHNALLRLGSQAGKVQVFSGVTGLPLRTITSTSENENLGFDAVGVGDVNHNGSIDYLVSAANLNTVYLIDGATP